MEGRIGHLHCHYRILAVSDAAQATAARLDRVVREQMPEACAAALEQALDDDPAVYVLRHLDMQVMLNMEGDLTDVRLAQRWGQHVARAALRVIAQDAQGSTMLVRFADQAAFVTQFIEDLLRGAAWNRWFYGAFAPLRRGSTADVIARVLQDNREHVPAILSRLHRDGALDGLLAALGDTNLNLVWQYCLHGPPIHPSRAPDTAGEEPGGNDPMPRGREELERPLFAGALRLLDSLALWADRRPSGDALFAGYVSSTPAPVDWRDRRALAMVMLAIIRYLADRDYLRRVDRAAHAEVLPRLDAPLAEFDWLDVEWLRAALLDLLAVAGSSGTDLPVRPLDRAPTPRQRALLDDLEAVLRDGTAALDRAQSDAPENALRLYAALIARAPRWSGDPLAGVVIQRLLSAHALLAQARFPAEAMRWLRQGGVQRLLHALPDDVRERAAGTVGFVAGLGEPGLALVETLMRGQASSAATPAVADAGRYSGGADVAPAPLTASIETGCAGVFLLLRAVMGARLPALVVTSGYPPGERLTPFGALLVALGLRWASAPGMSGGRIDPGLRVLAGHDGPATIEDLRAAWAGCGPEDEARFQIALLRHLAARRMVQGSTQHVYRLGVAEGRAILVAGDGSPGLWPLGHVIETDAAAPAIVASWLNAWEEATGHQVSTVSVDQSLSDIWALSRHPAGADVVIVPETEAAEAHARVSEIAETHRSGRAAFAAAMAALDHGLLALPDSDLTIALAASTLLRLWARWLRQFADSSVPYLLGTFIRRPGWITVNAQRIEVELQHRPLDIVLDMAGYTAELERVPWLGERGLRFHISGA
jgi:hypothetical protein